MLCQSAPINPRSGVASESTAFEPEWRRPTAEESCNDVEQRAGPVSQSEDPQASRSPVASSRRLRPRVSAGAPQQWPPAGAALGVERVGVLSLRLRDTEAGGSGRGAKQGAASPAGDPARPALPRRLRRRDLGAAGGSAKQLLRPEARSRNASAPRAAAGRPGLVARALLALIGAYQRSISPSLVPACRFQPTCSEYAHEAIERHGAIRGVWLAARRLLRCRPLGGRGYDPVPD